VIQAQSHNNITFEWPLSDQDQPIERHEMKNWSMRSIIAVYKQQCRTIAFPNHNGQIF